MRKKRKIPFEGPDYDVLIKRAEMMGQSDVLEAFEASLASITRYVSEYRRTRDLTLLEELKMSAMAFYVLSDTLTKREDGYGKKTDDVAPARQRGAHF